MIRFVSILILFLFGSFVAMTQELKATVEINTDMIQGTNKDLFDALRESIDDYLNTTRFSQAQIAANERIECRLMLTVAEYADDHVKGELTIQSSRPVYNSTYSSTLLNIKDSKIEFDFRMGQPLVYNEMEAETNLNAILDYYAFLIMRGLPHSCKKPKAMERRGGAHSRTTATVLPYSLHSPMCRPHLSETYITPTIGAALTRWQQAPTRDARL